jgi:hypothetical protein
MNMCLFYVVTKLIILLLKVFWNNIIIDLLEKIWKKKEEVVFELMVISKYGSTDDENMLKFY